MRLNTPNASASSEAPCLLRTFTAANKSIWWKRLSFSEGSLFSIHPTKLKLLCGLNLSLTSHCNVFEKKNAKFRMSLEQRWKLRSGHFCSWDMVSCPAHISKKVFVGLNRDRYSRFESDLMKNKTVDHLECHGHSSTSPSFKAMIPHILAMGQIWWFF